MGRNIVEIIELDTVFLGHNQVFLGRIELQVDFFLLYLLLDHAESLPGLDDLLRREADLRPGVVSAIVQEHATVVLVPTRH